MSQSTILVTADGHGTIKRYSDGYFYINNGVKGDKVPDNLLKAHRHILDSSKKALKPVLCSNITATPLHSWNTMFKTPACLSKIEQATEEYKQKLIAIRAQYQSEVFAERASKAGKSKG